MYRLGNIILLRGGEGGDLLTGYEREEFLI